MISILYASLVLGEVASVKCHLAPAQCCVVTDTLNHIHKKNLQFISYVAVIILAAFEDFSLF